MDAPYAEEGMVRFLVPPYIEDDEDEPPKTKRGLCEEIVYWPNSTQKLYTCRWVDGKRQHCSFRLDQHGNRIHKITWYDGVRHGEEIVWDSFRKIVYKAMWQYGKLHGTENSYDSTGRKQEMYTWKSGKITSYIGKQYRVHNRDIVEKQVRTILFAQKLVEIKACDVKPTQLSSEDIRVGYGTEVAHSSTSSLSAMSASPQNSESFSPRARRATTSALENYYQRTGTMPPLSISSQAERCLERREQSIVSRSASAPLDHTSAAYGNDIIDAPISLGDEFPRVPSDLLPRSYLKMRHEEEKKALKQQKKMEKQQKKEKKSKKRGSVIRAVFNRDPKDEK